MAFFIARCFAGVCDGEGDSAGLGEIVRTFTTVSRQGGKLKLLNLTKRIEDLLSITKLLTVFETFESEPEAIKSFS